MEIKNIKYKLSAESCDRIADEIMTFCAQCKIERPQAIRYRLSVEECLNHWLASGHEGEPIVLRLGKKLFTPYITIQNKGEADNPYWENTQDYGSFCHSILLSMNLKADYSYELGSNKLTFNIKKKPKGKLKALGMVIIGSLLVGVLGQSILPEWLRQGLLSNLITPVYNTFFNILGCIAGPMIFLSVTWGIYGIGDVATLGRIGNKMMISYIRNVFLVAICGLAVFPVIGPVLLKSSGSAAELGNILELILGMFPPNVVQPFLDGNTLQIIVLAVVFGIALLYLGKKTKSIAVAIEQINILVQFLMEVISRLVPYVIFLVIVNLLWSGSLNALSDIWIFFLLMIAAFIIVDAFFIGSTSVLQKVKPSILIKKAMPTFLIALSSASSAAAFGTSVSTCEEKYGIDASVTEFGIPLGMVVCKPIAALYNLLLVFYFARVYKVACTPQWLILAVFICAIVAIATPPIPGGGAIAYAVIFKQLNIPDTAVSLALTIDILSDFLITSFESLSLHMAMINIAAKLDMIDKKVLAADDS